jgi:hypothetical protein
LPQIRIHPLGELSHEERAKGFHPDRVDDRRRDHRHLAAIAIPAYQDYTVRSKVTEGLNLASSAKVSVVGRLPVE